ncbi:MAG: class I SAM-dependent methyltransferase [Candidatus Omnitrophica bacterium]|nr:class I SAM-dependent methyltransferase [Candidatus Omnitrophota bacterium]
MAMEVLQDKLQIRRARHELIKKGVSFIDPPLLSLMRKFGLLPGITIGDIVKSWDVLSTLDFLEGHVQQDEPILDIGCYASEVIVALHRLGYSDLTGIDINAGIYKMPHYPCIRYEIADFLNTGFPDAHFRAITAISVIEHGFNSQLLLKELSRLLKPNGYFIASFDYWPQKIDTRGINLFGMEWKIFSKDEIVDFIREAADCGLFPVAKMEYEAKIRPIRHKGKQYTFAWLALKKSA